MLATVFRIRIFPDRIRIFGRSGSELKKKKRSGQKDPDPKHWLATHFILVVWNRAFLARAGAKIFGRLQIGTTVPYLLKKKNVLFKGFEVNCEKKFFSLIPLPTAEALSRSR